MQSTLLMSLFVNMLMISKADHNTRHVRHSNPRNTHETQRRQQRQWQLSNYRSYEPNKQHHYPGFTNAERQKTADIINLLRELNNNLSTQKQRQYYQPIIVPYPVPLSIPSSNYGKPTIPNKPVPALPSRNNFADDEKDYMRPIMLKPVTAAPFTTTTTKISDSESAIVFKAENENDIRKPTRCEAAILVCCRFIEPDRIKTCFEEYGCSKTFATKAACEKRAIQTVIQRFTDTFGPK